MPDKITRQNAKDVPLSPLAETMIKGFMDQIDTDTRIARAREFSQTSGKPLGYMTPDGRLIDGDGKLIEKLPGMIIVRLNG